MPQIKKIQQPKSNNNRFATCMQIFRHITVKIEPR